MISMVDLARQDRALSAEIEDGMREVMASGRFLFGPRLRAFEKEAESYLQVRHAVGCASGSDALLLSLLALGIGAGDEVITTPLTFFATAGAIVRCGARPVFVDIEDNGFNLDPAEVEQALTARTRAILPVHLFGRPADVPVLAEIAKRRGLALIEDCAQAFGARVGGRCAGGWGDAGCFSFFPSKNLGAYGDAGMVVTNDEDLGTRLRLLANHGSVAPHDHRLQGFNSRLDELQAVVLRAKLRRIDASNAARRRAARRYAEYLANIEGIILPREGRWWHVYNQYTVLLPNRDAVREGLARRGIPSAVYYPRPLYRQPALRDFYPGRILPVAEKVSRHCLSLPLHPAIGDDEIQAVADAVRVALGESEGGGSRGKAASGEGNVAHPLRR